MSGRERIASGRFTEIRAALPRAAGFALLWWVLAEGRMEAWGVGLASVLLATLASLRLWPRGERRLSPVGVLAALALLALSLVGLGALLPWWLAPAPDTQGILASAWPPLLAAVLATLAPRLRLSAPNLPAAPG